MNGLISRWRNWIISLNSKGVPVPMIREPRTQQASVSLTLLFASFNIWLVSIIGKASGALGGIDPSQTLNMFMVCAGLYFGRKMQKSASGKITVDGKEDESK